MVYILHIYIYLYTEVTYHSIRAQQLMPQQSLFNKMLYSHIPYKMKYWRELYLADCSLNEEKNLLADYILAHCNPNLARAAKGKPERAAPVYVLTRFTLQRGKGLRKVRQ